MKNRVTIRDVAAEAKVSVATVSYVLNGKKKVSEQTKQRVLDVIDRLGFIPDLNARGLSVKDTRLFGIVVPQTEPGSRLMFHNLFYSELLGSIEYAARKRGYHVIISATDVTEDYLQLIQERNLAGVIIIGTYENRFFDRLNELDTTGVEPMSHVFPVNNVFREDVVMNGDDSEDMLKNAPAVKDGSYKVPKTVE